MNTPSSPSPKDQPPKPRISASWWLIMIALTIWNIWSLWPEISHEIAIPYTAFVDQINAGNIKDVQIDGAQISGTFQKGLPASDLIPPDQQAASLTTPQSVSTPQAASTPELFTSFTTTFPEAVGDPKLLNLLEAKGVVVNVKSSSNSFFVILLENGLPLLLLVLVWGWMGRKMMQSSQGGILGFGRSKARRYTEERPEVTFEDVAGVEEAKEELSEVVEFLRHPEKYHELGARIPRGVLLPGPPGLPGKIMHPVRNR